MIPAPGGALLLDFDGLVCDTERAARRSWRELYARLGADLDDALWARACGRRDGHVTAAAELARRVGRPVTREETGWRADRKRLLADREPLRPGVAALLDAADSRDLPAAVVSSSSRAWVGHHLARLGVRHRLAAVVTGDEAPPKPAPDLYLLALRRLGAHPDRSVAFEDSPTGVRAARAAGLHCVAVPSAASRAGDLHEADTVLTCLSAYRWQPAPRAGRGARAGGMSRRDAVGPRAVP